MACYRSTGVVGSTPKRGWGGMTPHTEDTDVVTKRPMSTTVTCSALYAGTQVLEHSVTTVSISRTDCIDGCVSVTPPSLTCYL